MLTCCPCVQTHWSRSGLASLWHCAGPAAQTGLRDTRLQTPITYQTLLGAYLLSLCTDTLESFSVSFSIQTHWSRSVSASLWHCAGPAAQTGLRDTRLQTPITYQTLLGAYLLSLCTDTLESFRVSFSMALRRAGCSDWSITYQTLLGAYLLSLCTDTLESFRVSFSMALRRAGCSDWSITYQTLLGAYLLSLCTDTLESFSVSFSIQTHWSRSVSASLWHCAGPAAQTGL